MESAQQAVVIPRPREEADPAAERLVFIAVENRADYQQNNGGRGTLPWLTLMGFVFLTMNCIMAVYRSRGDRKAIAFVVFSFGDLVLLFISLRMYESAPAGSSKRDWLKIAVWVLTTLLTLAFSAKVAAVMPPPVAVAVWLMSFATIAGGFVAFFVYKEKK